jgi:hypothetical protein
MKIEIFNIVIGYSLFAKIWEQLKCGEDMRINLVHNFQQAIGSHIRNIRECYSRVYEN